MCSPLAIALAKKCKLFILCISQDLPPLSLRLKLEGFKFAHNYYPNLHLSFLNLLKLQQSNNYLQELILGKEDNKAEAYQGAHLDKGADNKDCNKGKLPSTATLHFSRDSSASKLELASLPSSSVANSLEEFASLDNNFKGVSMP